MILMPLLKERREKKRKRERTNIKTRVMMSKISKLKVLMRKSRRIMDHLVQVIPKVRKQKDQVTIHQVVLPLTKRTRTNNSKTKETIMMEKTILI